jgi:enoyl-CoA hydratase/carnithine racemase
MDHGDRMSIRTDRHDRVMTIAFDRPERRNAITAAMYTAVTEALEAAAADPAVRVVLVTGSSDCFTSGNDVEDFLKNPPQADDSPVARFLPTIATFPKPLVAAPCGATVGVGVTMLLHCDVVYAGDNAKFQIPFVPLGICPEAGSSLLLPMIAGYQSAAEKLLFGEPFGADEAMRMGFVNRVLPAAEAIAFATGRAAKLAALPPASVRTTKRLLKSAWAEPLARHMREELAHFRQLLVAPEAREAMSAFMEKRQPDFSRFT